jgi:hypothetical protein
MEGNSGGGQGLQKTVVQEDEVVKLSNQPQPVEAPGRGNTRVYKPQKKRYTFNNPRAVFTAAGCKQLWHIPGNVIN